MRNYKFKLSDMMPNAWFYKLKDMGKPRNHSTASQTQHQIKKKPFHHEQELELELEQPQFTNHRHSYYFTSEPISYKADKLYNSPVNPKSTDVHFPDLPRKSSKANSRGRRRRRSIKSSSSSTKFVSPSVSAGCSCRATLDSVWAKTDSTPDYSASASPSPPDSSPEHAFDRSVLPDLGSDPDVRVSWSSSCSCRVSSPTADIILDMDVRNSTNGAQKIDKFDGLDSISGIELLPIRTKPAKFNDMVSEIRKRDTKDTEPVKYKRSSVKVEVKKVTGSFALKEEAIKTHKEQRISPGIRRISPSSQGLKLRSHSPRIASKKIQAYSRKSISSTKTRRKNLSDSFAIIKSSCDPQRDFRESMVEMIVENNIRAAKDLEELLACYLSLNSNEYHDIIVKVFEQIWFDLTDIKL